MAARNYVDYGSTRSAAPRRGDADADFGLPTEAQLAEVRAAEAARYSFGTGRWRTVEDAAA